MSDSSWVATRHVKLLQKGNRLYMRLAGEETEIGPVRLLWARPISGRGREIAVMSADKRDLLLLPGPEALEPESRELALRDLDMRYFRPCITRILRIRGLFGLRYVEAETDRGPCHFAVKDPRASVIRVSEDHWILKDTLGCRYEIPSLSGLDQASREKLAGAF